MVTFPFVDCWDDQINACYRATAEFYVHMTWKFYMSEEDLLTFNGSQGFCLMGEADNDFDN